MGLTREKESRWPCLMWASTKWIKMMPKGPSFRKAHPPLNCKQRTGVVESEEVDDRDPWHGQEVPGWLFVFHNYDYETAKYCKVLLVHGCFQRYALCLLQVLCRIVRWFLHSWQSSSCPCRGTCTSLVPSLLPIAAVHSGTLLDPSQTRPGSASQQCWRGGEHAPTQTPGRHRDISARGEFQLSIDLVWNSKISRKMRFFWLPLVLCLCLKHESQFLEFLDWLLQKIRQYWAAVQNLLWDGCFRMFHALFHHHCCQRLRQQHLTSQDDSMQRPRTQDRDLASQGNERKSEKGCVRYFLARQNNI